MRKIISLIVSFTLALMMVPAPAFAQVGGLVTAAAPADAPAAGDLVVYSQEPDWSQIAGTDLSVLPNGEEPSASDELFEAYVDSAFEKAATPVVRRVMLQAQAAASDTLARNQLSEKQQLIYDTLVPMIKQVAAGQVYDTNLQFSPDELIEKGYLQQTYTAQELGIDDGLLEPVPGKTDEYQFTADADAAVQVKIRDDYLPIYYALLQDFPYELYWFDKLVVLAPWLSYVGNNNQVTINNITFYFRVTIPYSESGDRFTFRTGSLPGKVTTAANNAAGVVNANKAKNDVRKLDAYRQYICENVDYDGVAAKDLSAYGDPSQLISVFDGDSSTLAICEGYSKAFKRLCDLTTFNNPTVTCYTASGMMVSSQGEYIPHMWNTVSINGNNYLVDVTNCDSYSNEPNKGTVGCWWNGAVAAPGTGLFMRGYEEPFAQSGDSKLSSAYLDGYQIQVPTSRTNRSSESTVRYHFEKSYADVLPQAATSLVNWDCPLDEAADAALSVDARVMAIKGGAATTSAEVTSLKADYDALSAEQKSLVQESPQGLDPGKAEANAAAATVKTLQWHKATVLSDGEYSNKAGRQGNAAWTCDSNFKKFEVKLYKVGEATPVLTRKVDFSNEANRTSFSYYLPQEYTALESGQYYFTVTPVLEAGASTPGESAILKSGVWTYAAPSGSLKVPSGIQLSDSVITWLQPSRSTDASADYIDQYGLWVYWSSTELSDEQLESVAIGDDGNPVSSGASFSLVAGVLYNAPGADAARWCTCDFGDLMKTFIDKNRIERKESGCYYFYVRAISANISRYKSSSSPALMKGLTAAQVTAKVSAQLDEALQGADEEQPSGGAAADLISGIHPAQLGIALEDAAVAGKVSALDALSGVAVSVEQGAGAPAGLFAGEGPSIVGAALNPLSADNDVGEVKLVIGAAAGGDLAVPDGLDASGAQLFSMNLEGVDDQENLAVPVRVSLPVPGGMAADAVVLLHYEGGSAAPTVIEPVIEEREGQSYASAVLTSFSDFAFAQPVSAASANDVGSGDEFDIDDGDGDGSGDGGDGDELDDDFVIGDRVNTDDIAAGSEIVDDAAFVVVNPSKPVADSSKSASKTSNSPSTGNVNRSSSQIAYRVSFSAGKASGLMTPQLAKPGSTITLKANAFTWKGHKFIGWKGSDGKAYADKARVKVTRDLTLDAQWAKVKTSKKTIYVLTNKKHTKIKATTSRKLAKRKLASGWKKLAVVKSGSKKITKLQKPGTSKRYYTSKSSKVTNLLSAGWAISAVVFYAKS